MAKINLAELIDAIDFDTNESESFINLKTGNIILITNEALSIAEDGDESDCPEWMFEFVEIAKDYLAHSDDYIPVPSQDDVNEYEVMEDFIDSLANDTHIERLFTVIKGKSPFRNFKDHVKALGIENDWYQFRDARYKQFALAWCEENAFEVDQNVLLD